MNGDMVFPGFVGLLFPAFAAAIKRLGNKYGWDKRMNDMLILAALLVVGAGVAFVRGEIDPRACASLDFEGCFDVIMGYILLVGTWAFGAYKMFYKPSGADDKIAGR